MGRVSDECSTSVQRVSNGCLFRERSSENYFSQKLVGKQDASKDQENIGKPYQQSVLSAGRPSVFNYKPLVQRGGFAAAELNISADVGQIVTDEVASPSSNDSFKIPKSNLFVPSLSAMSKKRDNPKHLDLSVLSDAVQENNRSDRLSSPIGHIDTVTATSPPSLPVSTHVEPTRNLDFSSTSSPQSRTDNRRSLDSHPPVNESILSPSSIHNTTQESTHETTIVQGPVGITLSKRDIYTTPPIEELVNFVHDTKVHLPDGFSIGRLGYGRVEWPGSISFSNVDLGDLVRFQRKQVIVYPDETKKPPIGEGFNRTAIVCLENIYPINKETKEEIRVRHSFHYYSCLFHRTIFVFQDPLSEEARIFSRILERKCIKMDCDFLEYDIEKGEWIFRVKHFSRYGFVSILFASHHDYPSNDEVGSFCLV